MNLDGCTERLKKIQYGIKYSFKIIQNEVIIKAQKTFRTDFQ